MLFLLLAAASIALAIFEIRKAARIGAPPVRSTLIVGGSAYLAGWLIQAIAYQAARGQAGQSAPFVLAFAQGLMLLPVTFALWLSLTRLVLHRVTRRDLFLIAPVVLLSIVVGAFTDLMIVNAALLAIPALLRVRWKSELQSGTLVIVGLFGVLFVLLNLLDPRFRPGPAPAARLPEGIVRYMDWVRALAALHILVALPRLLWGLNLPIRSVRRRLLASHLLTGLVPLALVLVFWGLSTFLSVTAERARMAGRLLAEETEELGMSLDAVLAMPGDRAEQLRQWGGVQEALTPGLRIWLLDSPDGAMGVEGNAPGANGGANGGAIGGAPGVDREAAPTLRRIFGDPVPGEAALAAWPASVLREGIVLLESGSYLGAARRVPGVAGGPPAAAILVPTEGFLSGAFQQKVDADVFLETRFVVHSADREFTASVRGSELHPASAGAALVPALEWADGEWSSRKLLLWARIGFFHAIRGLAQNVQENPFNLMPLVFLGVVAALFVLVEILTLGMVISMGRSILRSLHALRVGTGRLRSGNLRYRIPIEGDDELWHVAESFNEMTSDLEKARELEIENERLEGELELARQIQSRLLPGEVPTVARTELAGLSVPARHVGGDYYDLIPLADDRVVLIVADVSGKGIPAALLMSSFRASLLSRDLEREGPGESMARLNAFLHRSIETGRFVTAFLGIFHASSGVFRYSNAGHDPPIVFRKSGEITLLREGGLVLGLFGETVYAEGEVRLERDDLIALYTDGVTEATSEEGEFWGQERLVEIIRSASGDSCRRILRQILGEIRAFSGEGGQSDDITLVLARWRGCDVPVAEGGAQPVARSERETVPAVLDARAVAQPGTAPERYPALQPEARAEAEPSPRVPGSA